MSKIGEVTGGTRSDGGYGSVVTLTDKKTNTVSYEYDVQNGWYQTFHIKFENPDNLASIKKKQNVHSIKILIHTMAKRKKPSVTVTIEREKIKTRH